MLEHEVAEHQFSEESYLESGCPSQLAAPAITSNKATASPPL